jgi:hypothetical protein
MVIEGNREYAKVMHPPSWIVTSFMGYRSIVYVCFHGQQLEGWHCVNTPLVYPFRSLGWGGWSMVAIALEKD